MQHITSVLTHVSDYCISSKSLVRISQRHYIGQQSANTDCNSTVVCTVEMGSQAVVMNINH